MCALHVFYWGSASHVVRVIDTSRWSILLCSRRGLVGTCVARVGAGLMPDFTHLPEGPRMIELGAGLGRFTANFSERCKHVLAVDFIEKLIEQVRGGGGSI